MWGLVIVLLLLFVAIFVYKMYQSDRRHGPPVEGFDHAAGKELAERLQRDIDEGKVEDIDDEMLNHPDIVKKIHAVSDYPSPGPDGLVNIPLDGPRPHGVSDQLLAEKQAIAARTGRILRGDHLQAAGFPAGTGVIGAPHGIHGPRRIHGDPRPTSPLREGYSGFQSGGGDAADPIHYDYESSLPNGPNYYSYDWPSWYYSGWPPGLSSSLYRWQPGFETTGWSWWLRPGKYFGNFPYGRWYRNNGRYFYIQN